MSRILGVQPTHIGEFLKLLNEKYEKLEQVGISRDMISIWYLYEYDQQCNMEFEAEQLKKIRGKWNKAMHLLLDQ